jgi:hypothetical protein
MLSKGKQVKKVLQYKYRFLKINKTKARDFENRDRYYDTTHCIP